MNVKLLLRLLGAILLVEAAAMRMPRSFSQFSA